ncbi:MAG TPA: hypothetical protein VGG26_09040 [Terracidiphilus sp.]|jgi:hypothetical protein
MPRSARSTPPVDALIARSKMLTTDLMALRHELNLALASRTPVANVRACRGRLSLVLDSVRAMSKEMHELWEECGNFGVLDRSAVQNATALTAGHLRLTSGGR